MNTKPERRLYLYFATENDTAVILLRAARRLWAMILWDRARDRFTEGQWLKREIDPAACALSPNGAHFLCFVPCGMAPTPEDERQFGHIRPPWSGYWAISRPPWFTALALYPHGRTAWAYGAFLDAGHVWIDGMGRIEDQIGRAEGLVRVFAGATGKGCNTGLRLADGRPAPLPRDVTRRLMDLLPQVGRDGRPPTLMWLWMRAAARDQDAIRARYDTLGGRLFRRDGMDVSPIRDFDDLAFHPVRAPYDDRPETAEPAPWHPPDGAS